MLSKAELLTALKVFRPWLEEEAKAAELLVSRQCDPAKLGESGHLGQLAEMKGVSRALSEVPGILERRVMELRDE